MNIPTKSKLKIENYPKNYTIENTHKTEIEFWNYKQHVIENLKPAILMINHNPIKF